MRTTTIVSITLPPKMLAQAMRVAEKENRTKSELFREALRRYLINQEWQELRAIGRKNAKRLDLKSSDVNRLIHEYRAEKAGSRKRSKVN